MAEYLPLFAPGESPVYAASATIVAGNLLEVTGSGTVGPAGAASTKVVGVAAFDAVSGDKVTIYCGGIQRLITSGTVTAGDLCAAGAAGTVASIGANVFGTLIGVALTTATTGLLVEVQMQR